MEWLSYLLERLRNGTALKHSHLIAFSHLSNLENFFIKESIVHMHSSNGTLKITQVFVPSPRHFEFAFFFYLLIKSLYGAQVGKVSRHTCIAYFAKSNNGSMKKNIIQSNQDVQVCGYEEAILILFCSLKLISLFIQTLKKNPFVRSWAIFFFFSFFSCLSFSFINFFL